MIQFHQVTKQYPGNDFALGEIDFNIDEGEFVFLIGPSGSGKTTLIRMLIREEKPSQGKIFFDDRDITNLSRNNVYKLRRQVGVIFQDYKLIPDKNAYENVAFAMEAAGRSNREISETVPYVLDIVGLSHRSNAFPEQLSGGEKQRIAIARAVSNNPRLLIADEPTGNLDPGSAWDIVQILSKINNWGTTVIMSTHGTDIVNTLNKRVIQMESGQIVRDDNKGMYEITTRFEDRVLANNDSDTAEEKEPHADARKGPIKVNIDNNEQQDKPADKKFNLSWLKIWKHEEQMPVVDKPSLVEENSEMEETVDAANAVLEDNVEMNIDTSDQAEMQQIITDADHTPVTQLKLKPQIIADLQTAGYHDVEDIISAGPEKLANELIIDPEEVVLISEAVSKFVQKEDVEIKSGVKSKTSKKQDKKVVEDFVEPERLVDEDPPAAQMENKQDRKSQRIKLDLAGKKKKNVE